MEENSNSLNRDCRLSSYISDIGSCIADIWKRFIYNNLILIKIFVYQDIDIQFCHVGMSFTLDDSRI